jgi:hypothetical protein
MSTVEEVALEKGEECISIFMNSCGKLSEYYNSVNANPDPEVIINLAMKILVHWYLDKDEIDEKELIENQDFLQKVIAFTFRHRETMSIEN